MILKLVIKILKASNRKNKRLKESMTQSSPVTHKIQMMKNQGEIKRRRIKRAKYRNVLWKWKRSPLKKKIKRRRKVGIPAMTKLRPQQSLLVKILTSKILTLLLHLQIFHIIMIQTRIIAMSLNVSINNNWKRY